jgi:MFS family permease
VYLFRLGYNSLEIGIVTAAGLGATTIATALITWRADTLGRKPTLITLALLSAAGGVGLAFASSFAGILLFAVIGMVNAMGTDRSASYVLEQSVLPNLVPDSERTWAFSWYHLASDVGGAVGALAAVLPTILNYRTVFLGYSALWLVCASAYVILSNRIETPESQEARPSLTATSKARVYRLAALFAIDSFGGGFLTDAVVAYWFFRRFGASESQLGVLFFVIHILNALSHLGAAWLAKKIGLVKTMVFTHLPSSVFLIAVPFAPNFSLAAVLLLARESLVEMDVPTRQSYVAAIVQPHERTFAAGVTNLGRTAFWAIASAVGGALMQTVTFSAPLVAGGAIKILYDVLLYRKFRHIKPPEEAK